MPPSSMSAAEGARPALRRRAPSSSTTLRLGVGSRVTTRSAHCADPVDPVRSDLAGVDGGLLMDVGGVRKGREEVRTARQKPAVEAFVQEPQQIVAAMQALSACPLAKVRLPLLPRSRPLVAAPNEPVLLVLPEPLEAPLRGFLVELLPGPFRDDQSSAARQRPREPVDHLAGVVYVMKRGRCDCGIELPGELEPFELDAMVFSALRRFRVDALGVVAAREQERDETPARAAAKIEDTCRRRRQVGTNERPERSQPAIARRHDHIVREPPAAPSPTKTAEDAQEWPRT